MKFSQERLNVWMYKFLLGTLSSEDTRTLKQELDRRIRENETHSALERKLNDAFVKDGETNKQIRKRLAELLDDWEKRNWGG